MITVTTAKAVAPRKPRKMVRRGCANLVSVSILIISLCAVAFIGNAVHELRASGYECNDYGCSTPR